MITKSLILFGCLCLGVTTVASPTKQADVGADKLHTPAEGSAERAAILEGLRRHWQASRNPDDGKTYRGNITFRVSYLKVHNADIIPVEKRR